MTATRKLAAILAADVAGYSRLMGSDEEGTLERLKAHRRELIDPKIAEHRGRIAKTTGDGMLVEFGSVVDAIRCAVEVQGAMVDRNAPLPADQRIEFRVGINLGDIIIDGDDIYGDGVNIAARLEAIAEPGSVNVSAAAWEHARGKVPFRVEDLGEQRLKNIERPVRVYCIAGGTSARSEGTRTSLTDKPSIAVLPFNNMSGDADQEYFSDGITEDIITELSRFRSLLVIARNSSFSYKGRSPRVQDVERELGVRYVVEGSVRKSGNRLRVTAQLAEAASGAHLWAERYDREVGEIFVVQDELVRTIVSTLVGRVDEAGKKRSKGLSEAGLQAYDLYLRALTLQDANSKESYCRAGELLQRAIHLDPEFAEAHHQLSLGKFVEWMAYWAEDRDQAFSASVDAAKRALSLDDTSSSFHAQYGQLLMYLDEHDEARGHFEKAVQLNPNDAKAIALYGQFLTSVHELEDAMLAFDKALRLNPLAPNWINWLRGIAYYTAHRYSDAIRSLKSIGTPMNEVRGWLAASYAQAGKVEQARAALDVFLRTAAAEMTNCPPRELTAWRAYWRAAIPYTRATDEMHLLDGLRMAGLVDQIEA